ncbi:hypothetical protein B0H10DRAFT_2163983 [Mycena sp. CBHHK59/15]|nr:hypothetical protein B0H10DRAFT_2163983 [Mycena sp. CBHHK59/15]
MGSCLDLLLQGVLSSQFVNYFTWYSDDMRSLRLVVAVLALLTVLKSIQVFAIIWVMFIASFGDFQEAISLNFTTWWQSGNPLMVALIGLYVQCYFCFRLYVISKKWYVVAPIATVFLFAFLSMAVATYYISTKDTTRISDWSGDITLSMTTAYFLIKSKKRVLPQTVGLISGLVRLTFQTAAPAALCAMFNLMFSLIFAQTYPGGVAFIATTFNLALPKLYAISMMWTLNARRSIRAIHSSRNGMTTSSNEISGGRSRAQRRATGDMELGPIQVLTQSVTTQHIDLRTGDSLKADGDATVTTPHTSSAYR